MALSQSIMPDATLPTLYEYYTAGGIKSGLSADQDHFTLNGKNISLYSGAMHYFRIPRELYQDRLRKLRATGLNTVETYVPWNLHEPTPGQFDFGDGGSDFEYFLNLKLFLKIAQEEDLLVIMRPGPYICAEFEFGGFPSWLLREKNIKFRSSDPKFMGPVKRFFNALLPILAAFQFINGGPIVSFQIENEYGSTQSPTFTTDKEYLRELRQLYLDHNITGLFTTADGVVKFYDKGTIPDLFLVTANFGANATKSFDTLESMQPGRPKMAMEYYPGWFDTWGSDHQARPSEQLIANLTEILNYPGSFNLYMFHGGTNFGFMNGAQVDNDSPYDNALLPVTTSYDYNAPIDESGGYTIKHMELQTYLQRVAEPKTKLPQSPRWIYPDIYPWITINEYIPLKNLIDSQSIKLEYEKPIAMELLDINNGSGQSYGYITYRKENLHLSAGANLTILGHVHDTVLVLVNGKQIAPPLRKSEDLNHFGFYRLANSSIILTDQELHNATIDLVVENWGRLNYGKLEQYYQFKGLWQGDILIDGEVIKHWQHIPLEFKSSWTRSLDGWRTFQNNTEPGLYRGTFTMKYPDKPRDTYLDMRKWIKGIVIVNGFVLGRYARIGPQQCLFLPAPLVWYGVNEFIIFEHYEGSHTILTVPNQMYQVL